MTRQRRRWFTAAALAVILAGAYYWLFLQSPAAEGKFDINMREVRRLAASLPGELPGDIRYEHVMDFNAPNAATVIGDSWKQTTLWGVAYQFVYSDHTAILDSTMNADQAKALGTVTGYYPQAYEHLMQAMTNASLIFVTHEHPDHIGGLAAHPDLARLLSTSVKLNKDQISNAEHTAPARFPENAFAHYKPIQYGSYYALAPGIVLIRNPGHTVGSQMVFVRKADGTELLFLGDVAWTMRNVKLIRGKPRFTANKVGEKRESVLPQLRAVHSLSETSPTVVIVPGHDAGTLVSLTKRRVMKEGFDLVTAMAQ